MTEGMRVILLPPLSAEQRKLRVNRDQPDHFDDEFRATGIHLCAGVVERAQTIESEIEGYCPS